MNLLTIRNPVSLNGPWQFCIDPDGGKGDPIGADSRQNAWRKVLVPSDLRTCCPDLPEYEGRAWYRKVITMETLPCDKRTVVRFEGANYDSFLYLNGRFVGRNQQGYLPFEYDVTDFLEAGNNTLLMLVDSARCHGDLPRFFGWKNAGGLIRDVVLYQTGLTYFSQVSIQADMHGAAEIILMAQGPAAENMFVDMAVTDQKGQTVFAARLPFAARLSHQFILENAARWSPEDPNLYQVTCTLTCNETAIDCHAVTYGYRSICVADGKILFNGAPLFLKGFNRHEDNPETGGAVAKAYCEADFQLMKDAGANFIRMAHYPHDSYELELADRLGLILLEEIPLNAVLIPFNEEIALEDARMNQLYDNSVEMLARLMARDRNHPSVCIWSVSNELDEQEPAINQMNNALIHYARSLDSTRLVVHVNMPMSLTEQTMDHIFTYDDVICLNQYPTMSMRQTHGKVNYNVEESAASLEKQITQLKRLYPGKPVVLTEFGYMTGVAGDGMDSEEIQSDCIRAEYRAIRTFAEGASVWEFADHLWPKYITMLQRERSAYGLLTRDRKPKKAFAVYSELLQED